MINSGQLPEFMPTTWPKFAVFFVLMLSLLSTTGTMWGGVGNACYRKSVPGGKRQARLPRHLASHSPLVVRPPPTPVEKNL